MDVAEQALAALDMLSKKHAKSILHSVSTHSLTCNFVSGAMQLDNSNFNELIQSNTQVKYLQKGIVL